jgi:hypothetical protein
MAGAVGKPPGRPWILCGMQPFQQDHAISCPSKPRPPTRTLLFRQKSDLCLGSDTHCEITGSSDLHRPLGIGQSGSQLRESSCNAVRPWTPCSRACRAAGSSDAHRRHRGAWWRGLDRSMDPSRRDQRQTATVQAIANHSQSQGPKSQRLISIFKRPLSHLLAL